MKNNYKIHEISRLYGIGPDSLRYYERLGILKPKRDTNGYRLYNLKDIYKLNIIKDLRRLDLSMAQIKEYLDSQSIENTLLMLEREQDLVRTQLTELKEKELLLKKRISALKGAASAETGVIQIKHLPARAGLRLSERITRDEEMDFVIKKLHRRYEEKLQDFGTQSVGAFLSVEDLAAGRANVYDSVFFLLENENGEQPSAGVPSPHTDEQPLPAGDFLLPAGDYLSCFYRGSYNQNRDRIAELSAFAASRGLTPAGAPFELYAIDNRDTGREEEFLTEIQMAVKS